MRSRTKSILALIPALAFLLAAPVHAEHDYRNPSGWVDWRGTGFLVGPDLFMTCNHLGNIKGVAIFFDSWIDGVKQDGHYRVTVAEELWRGGGKADIALWRVSPIEKKQSQHYGKQIGDVVGFYEIDLQPPPAKDAAVFFGGGSHYSERHGKVLWTNDRYIAHNAQGSGGFSGSPTFVDGRSKVAGVYSMIVWGNRREDYSDRISYVWDDIKQFFVTPPAEPSIKLVEEHDYRNPSGWVDWRGTGFLVGPDLFMTCDHLGNIKGVAIFFDTWVDGVKQDGHYRVTVAEELWRGGGKADIALWRVSPIDKKQSQHYGKQIGDVVGFYEIDLQPPPAKDAAVFFGGGSRYSERHGKVLWSNDRYIVHNAQGSGGFSGSPTFVDGRSEVAGVCATIVLVNNVFRETHSERISYVWDDIKQFFVTPPAEPSIKLVEEWHGRNPLTLSGDASIQVRVPRVNLDYLHFVVAEDSALTGKEFEIDIPWNAAATGDAWCKSVDGQDWKEISVAAGNPIVLPYDELTFTRGQSHVSIQINMPEIRGKDRAADWEEGSYKDRRFSIRTPYFETFRYRFIFMGFERGDVNRDRFLSPHDAEHVPWRVWWR